MHQVLGQPMSDSHNAENVECRCAGFAAVRVHDHDCPAKPWQCTICRTFNPQDADWCRQCEYSRMIMRDGKSVDRDGYR